MNEMIRNTSPTFLEDKKVEWTDKFVKSNNFWWHNFNDEILNELKIQTNNHCAFCDRCMSPFGDASEEIEHFKPKSKFPEFAFEWTNLYAICTECNKIKNDRFDDLLLRPDVNYLFVDFFWYNFLSGEIEIQNNINQASAKKTLELYGLNRKKLVNRRLNYLLNYSKIEDKTTLIGEEKPFRFIKYCLPIN